jgi:ribonuclease P protein component
MPTVRQIFRFTEQEIKELLAHARRTHRSPEMDILIAPACLDFGRLLVVTPARIGTAPQRNIFKRRIKSIFYQEKLFNLKFDCIVIAKLKATTLDFEQIKKALFKALSNKQAQS